MSNGFAKSIPGLWFAFLPVISLVYSSPPLVRLTRSEHPTFIWAVKGFISIQGPEKPTQRTQFRQKLLDHQHFKKGWDALMEMPSGVVSELKLAMYRGSSVKQGAQRRNPGNKATAGTEKSQKSIWRRDLTNQKLYWNPSRRPQFNDNDDDDDGDGVHTVSDPKKVPLDPATDVLFDEGELFRTRRDTKGLTRKIARRAQKNISNIFRTSGSNNNTVSLDDSTAEKNIDKIGKTLSIKSEILYADSPLINSEISFFLPSHSFATKYKNTSHKGTASSMDLNSPKKTLNGLNPLPDYNKSAFEHDELPSIAQTADNQTTSEKSKINNYVKPSINTQQRLHKSELGWGRVLGYKPTNRYNSSLSDDVIRHNDVASYKQSLSRQNKMYKNKTSNHNENSTHSNDPVSRKMLFFENNGASLDNIKIKQDFNNTPHLSSLAKSLSPSGNKSLKYNDQTSDNGPQLYDMAVLLKNSRNNVTLHSTENLNHKSEDLFKNGNYKINNRKTYRVDDDHKEDSVPSDINKLNHNKTTIRIYSLGNTTLWPQNDTLVSIKENLSSKTQDRSRIKPNPPAFYNKIFNLDSAVTDNKNSISEEAPSHLEQSGSKENDKLSTPNETENYNSSAFVRNMSRAQSLKLKNESNLPPKEHSNTLPVFDTSGRDTELSHKLKYSNSLTKNTFLEQDQNEAEHSRQLKHSNNVFLNGSVFLQDSTPKRQNISQVYRTYHNKEGLILNKAYGKALPFLRKLSNGHFVSINNPSTSNDALPNDKIVTSFIKLNDIVQSKNVPAADDVTTQKILSLDDYSLTGDLAVTHDKTLSQRKPLPSNIVQGNNIKPILGIFTHIKGKNDDMKHHNFTDKLRPHNTRDQKVVRFNDTFEADDVPTYDQFRKTVPSLKEGYNSQGLVTHQGTLNRNHSLSPFVAKIKTASPFDTVLNSNKPATLPDQSKRRKSFVKSFQHIFSEKGSNSRCNENTPGKMPCRNKALHETEIADSTNKATLDRKNNHNEQESINNDNKNELSRSRHIVSLETPQGLDETLQNEFSSYETRNDNKSKYDNIYGKIGNYTSMKYDAPPFKAVSKQNPQKSRFKTFVHDRVRNYNTLKQTDTNHNKRVRLKNKYNRPGPRHHNNVLDQKIKSLNNSRSNNKVSSRHNEKNVNNQKIVLYKAAFKQNGLPETEILSFKVSNITDARRLNKDLNGIIHDKKSGPVEHLSQNNLADYSQSKSDNYVPNTNKTEAFTIVRQEILLPQRSSQRHHNTVSLTHEFEPENTQVLNNKSTLSSQSTPNQSSTINDDQIINNIQYFSRKLHHKTELSRNTFTNNSVLPKSKAFRKTKKQEGFKGFGSRNSTSYKEGVWDSGNVERDPSIYGKLIILSKTLDIIKTLNEKDSNRRMANPLRSNRSQGVRPIPDPESVYTGNSGIPEGEVKAGITQSHSPSINSLIKQEVRLLRMPRNADYAARFLKGEVRSVRPNLAIPTRNRLKSQPKYLEEKPEWQKANTLGSTKSDGSLHQRQKHPLKESRTWPWQMSIQEQYRHGWHHICHGAFIHPRVLLTTAECIYWKKLPTLRVVKHRIIDNITSLADGSFIKARILHPNFIPNRHRHQLRRNDLSLLFLQNELGIRPVAWNEPIQATGKHCMTGRNDRTVQIVPNRDCLHHYNRNYLPRASHVCAYGLPCDGQNDRGSPLVCIQPGGTPYLVGLSARQYGCHNQRQRAVYERLKPHINWINDHLLFGLS